MAEFFVNLWNWIVANKDEIILTITSATFISFVVNIITMIKTAKAKIENANAVTKLNETVEKLENLANKYEILLNDVIELKSEVSELNKNFVEYKQDVDESLVLIADKLNCIIEAQINVYSTINDDTLRTNVNNILTTGKYKEVSKVTEMQNKVDELEKQLLNKTDEIKESVVNTVANVKKVTKNIDKVRRA